MTTRNETTVEVSTIWSQTSLDVLELTASKGKAKFFSVGEDPRCNCWVEPREIGGLSRLDLIGVREGEVVVRVPSGSQVVLATAEHTLSGVDQLEQMGWLRPSNVAPEIRELPLQAGWLAEISVGDLSFKVQRTQPDRLPRGGAVINWNTARWTGMSLAVHAVFLALLFAIPPAPTSIAVDNMNAGNRFSRYLIAPAQLEPTEVPLWTHERNEPTSEGRRDEGRAHSGPAGQMGDSDAPDRDRRYAIRDNGLSEMRMSRERLREIAAHSGIVSALDSEALSSPFATGMENGPDPENALGHMFGAVAGDAFGYDGLSVSGTGRRGGNGESGVVGIGNLGHIGRFRSGGNGDQGGTVGRLPHGDRRSTGPAVRTGEATVLAGTLARDVIRRRIRLHRAEVTHCYQSELNSRPDLAGRVSIRFVINQDGRVTVASVASSTVDSPAVGRCVANVMRRISFPSPGDGVVVVNYPFTFVSN